MNLLLLLALAVPLSCLAFLSSLALLGVATLSAVIHVLGASGRAGRNGLASDKQTTPPGSYLHRAAATRNDPSFDHLVGAAKQVRAYGDAESLGGF